MEVNILGTNYRIEKHKNGDDNKLESANGYCETYSKKIVLETIRSHPMNYEKIEEFEKKVLRHEIVHAFLFESGIDSSSEWARNEEIVDWIALQFPKLLDAFKETECI